MIDAKFLSTQLGISSGPLLYALEAIVVLHRIRTYDVIIISVFERDWYKIQWPYVRSNVVLLFRKVAVTSLSLQAWIGQTKV